MREWPGQLPGEPEARSARSPTYADTAAKAMEAENFHESEIEKHFEQNTKGKMSCEWTFERDGEAMRAIGRTSAQRGAWDHAWADVRRGSENDQKSTAKPQQELEDLRPRSAWRSTCATPRRSRTGRGQRRAQLACRVFSVQGGARGAHQELISRKRKSMAEGPRGRKSRTAVCVCVCQLDGPSEAEAG